MSPAFQADEQHQLEQAIAHLETQRSALSDAVVEAALGPLRERLAYLRRASRASKSLGERRIVTVLFCDVTGSTALAEQLDPEEWAAMMNGIFQELIEPVERFGGTVARLMGDGILAFFGAPTAHEDDPERAVLAGLDIVSQAHTYRDELRKERGLTFDVRVGINTGLTVVGDVGSETAGEYTAMGDAVNLAARMEQTAKPGTVQISEATHKLVAALFEIESLGSVRAKGKSDTVVAYRVIRRRSSANRFPESGEDSANLVGRHEELEILRSLAGQVRAGGGQIISLIGEAGLGKSRLIEELKGEWFANRPGDERAPIWREFASTSYGGNRPYGTFQNQIRQGAGINSTDSSQSARRKLKHMLADDPGKIQLQILYETLLGLDEQGQTNLEGNVFRGRLFAAMQESVRAETEGRRAALIFEDMHWTDAASLSLEAHLLQLCRSSAILIIFAFRPDQEAPIWKLREQMIGDYGPIYTEIRLQPLAAEESGHLVKQLFVNCELPATVRKTILNRSDGNPFFMEEIARALTEQGLLVTEEYGLRWRADAKPDDVNIPANVQTLLAARIDRLSGDVRRTLQLAAVIGRSFYFRVLETISENDADLAAHLNFLQKAELIQEAGQMPEWEFSFRHALTQEAAYKTLLRQERRSFHLRVGQALERLFPERLEELAPLLAMHFSEAQDVAKAIEYFTIAGDSAFRLYANVEAADHYRRALSLVDSFKSDAQSLIHLYRRRGRALDLQSDHDGAVDNYHEMISLAREREDESMELAGLNALATIHATVNPRFDKALAESLSKRALILSRQFSDRAAEARAHWNLMLAHTYGLGDAKVAVDHGEASLIIARKHNLREQLAYTLTDLVQAYGGIGKWDRGIKASEESRPIWRELGDLTMLANNLSSAAIPYLLTGNHQQAISVSKEAHAICRDIGNAFGQVTSVVLVSQVYWDLGEPVQAILDLERVRAEVGDQMGVAHSLAFGSAGVAWIYAALGASALDKLHFKLATEMAESMPGAMRPWHYALLALRELEMGNLVSAAEFVRRSRDDVALGGNGTAAHASILLAGGRLSLEQGRFNTAVDEFGGMLSHMQAAGIRFLLPDALFHQGRALIALGRDDAGIASIVEARRTAESLNSRRILWPILAFLAEVEQDADRSEKLRLQAVRLVEYIADHTGSAELKTAFEAHAPVVKLLPLSQ